MSSQAEIAVIGAALLDERACDIVCETVKPVMLQSEARRLVLETILALRGRGVKIDTVTVGDDLTRRGKIDQVGGPVGLYDATVQTPSVANVEAWCRQVTDAFRRRQIRSAVERLRVEVDEAVSVDDLVDAAVDELLATSSAPAVVDPKGLLSDFGQRLENGIPRVGWESPWSSLDFFRLPQNGLTIVTGLPGSGKSTMLDVWLAGLMKKHDTFRPVFFSPEMSPADHHLHELVKTAMGCEPSADPVKASEWAQWFVSRAWWVDDDRDSSTSGVLAQARRLVRMGANCLVVDPYNNLEPDAGGRRGERQDLEIQALLRRLRRFARSLGVAVVVVAHPKKMERVPSTDAVYKIPHAGDISGGQEFWNHADAIVSVWRNQSGEHPGEFGEPWDVTVTVSKVRFGKWGRTGKGKIRFDERARRYSALSVV